MPKIMIEVSGGVVVNVTTTEEMEIFIVDHDSLESGLEEDFENARNQISPDVCNELDFQVFLEDAINEHIQEEE